METRPAIKPLLAHISPGRVTAGWNRPGTEGKEMKEARGVCGTRGKGAMGGGWGRGGRRGGRGEDGGSKRRERRLDESQDEEKVGKCGAGDKKQEVGEKVAVTKRERETQPIQK